MPSITNAARAGSVSILRDATAAPPTRGYFKVTICSPRVGLHLLPGRSQHADRRLLHAGQRRRRPRRPRLGHRRLRPPADRPDPQQLVPGAAPDGQARGHRRAVPRGRVVGLPATISIPTLTATKSPTPTISPTVTDNSDGHRDADHHADRDAHRHARLLADHRRLAHAAAGRSDRLLLLQGHQRHGPHRRPDRRHDELEQVLRRPEFLRAYFTYWYRWGSADPTPPSDATPPSPIALAAAPRSPGMPTSTGWPARCTASTAPC